MNTQVSGISLADAPQVGSVGFPGPKGDVGDVNPQMPILVAAAEDAAAAAEDAAAAAGASETAALAAQGAAETARTQAQTAQAAAEAARDAAAASAAEAAATSAAFSAAALLSWAYNQTFRVVSATRDSNGAITTASIVWPDGATGTFTTDTASTAFPGAIDAWHATYVNGAITKTITQPAVTRDANGAVTAQPAITIA